MGRNRADSRGHAQSGVALIWVIGLLLFASVPCFSLYQLMLNQHLLAHRVWQRHIAASLGRSLISLAAARLAEELDRPRSPLWERLWSSSPAGPIVLALQEDLAAITAAWPGARLSIAIQLKDPSPLAQRDDLTTFLLDPFELSFPVQMLVEASYGGAEEVLTVQKELRVQSLIPGAVTKFTLWAGELTPDGGNTFANDIRGRPTGQGPNRLPFVLHNEGTAPATGSTDPGSYLRRGYIYLGGTPQLKMTAGEESFGELFALRSLLDREDGTGRRPPPAFRPDGLPAFFDKIHAAPPGAPAGVTGYEFSVAQMIPGFYFGPGAKGRTLADALPRSLGMATATSSVLSSGLHLYGKAESPSGTLVLGHVYRSYPLVSGVTVDIDGDRRADGLVKRMDERAAPFPQGLGPLPAAITAAAASRYAGQSIPLTSGVTWSSMFDEGQYDLFASRLVNDDPYTSGYNFLYRRSEDSATFYPTDEVFKGIQETFTLTRQDRPHPLFSGAAAGVDPDRLIRRAVYRVSDRSELLELFARGRSLALGATILIAEADEEISLDGFWVADGGVLVSLPKDRSRRSSFKVRNLSIAEDSFGLVVCSLDGDCLVDFSNSSPTRPLALSVVAPRGRLRNLSRSNPVCLEGALFVGTCDLAEMPEGGDLYYDQRLDPTGPQSQEAYRAHLSDDETIP